MSLDAIAPPGVENTSLRSMAGRWVVLSSFRLLPWVRLGVRGVPFTVSRPRGRTIDAGFGVGPLAAVLAARPGGVYGVPVGHCDRDEATHDASMSRPREVRSYEYVNQPYERVREALLADPLGTFRAATRAAADRARSVAAALRVNIAGVDVGTEIDITLGEVVEAGQERGQGRAPSTRIGIEWEAARQPRLFPLMRAELSVYPLTATESQLDFQGSYEPPLGPVGSVLDTVLGHRIAEASVHRFVVDVAHHLRATLDTG